MSVSAEITALIDRAEGIADTQATRADGYAQQAISAANVILDFGTAQVGYTPNVKLDAVSSTDLVMPAGLDDISLLPSTIDDLTNRITEAFHEFFSRYFPNDCEPHVKAVQWLCDVLEHGGNGIPIAVENAIWQRDRSRILVDADNAVTETLATFAARGFPTPPGAARHQVMQIHKAAHDNIAKASTERAIQAVQLAIENAKFALQQSLDWRVKSIAAASDYMRLIASQSELAVNLVRAQIEIRAKAAEIFESYYRTKIQAASAYNSAKLEYARLLLEPPMQTSRNRTALNTAWGTTQAHISQARATAALGAAKAAGDIGAAAMSGINSIAHYSRTEAA